MFQRRTFAELISVLLVCAVLLAIALPLYARTEAEVRGDLAADQLWSVRDAIDLHVAEHGRLPGSDGRQETLKSDLREYLGTFPACPVGDALFPNEIEIVRSDEDMRGGYFTWHGWKYNVATGEFIINYHGCQASGRRRPFDAL